MALQLPTPVAMLNDYQFGAVAEQFSTLAFLPFFEAQKVIFFPL